MFEMHELKELKAMPGISKDNFNGYKQIEKFASHSENEILFIENGIEEEDKINDVNI
jgi:hypothetical protein